MLCLMLQFFQTKSEIKTTGLAGGLLCPYKGLLLASACKRTEQSDARTTFSASAKAVYFLRLSAGSPVNGSIYSFSDI